ncbi:MAG: FtsH protease activity modulator HflK [Clostridiales bacterium]|nr:FtsH protease activity modulator HflK [Clostridiales bacterium]
MEKTITNVVVIVVILALLAFIGVNGIYNLGNTEHAVIQRFGEVVNTVDEPGIHFKIPVIDKVTTQNVQNLYSVQYGYQIATSATTTDAATYVDVDEERIVLTEGGYLVDVGAIVQYRIIDAAAYIFNCDDPEGTIRLAFEAVLRRNMQNKPLDVSLVQKDDIAVEVLPELQRKLDAYGLGVKVDSVKLTDVLLPDPVQEAYDGVNIARNEKDSLELDAQKYSNEKLPKANADATVLVNGAKAYKETKVAQAKGDVLAFEQILEKYQTSKEITARRLYIEMMEKVMSRTSKKFIIDLDSNGDMIKYLPLNPQSLN